MDWTDEVIVKLRQLWAEGLSTAEIGRRLNISKNAVVGKAHRLNLSPRPSPIRRLGADTPARTPAPRRAQGPKHAALRPLPRPFLSLPNHHHGRRHHIVGAVVTGVVRAIIAVVGRYDDAAGDRQESNGNQQFN